MNYTYEEAKKYKDEAIKQYDKLGEDDDAPYDVMEAVNETIQYFTGWVKGYEAAKAESKEMNTEDKKWKAWLEATKAKPKKLQECWGAGHSECTFPAEKCRYNVELHWCKRLLEEK
ncbi:MAG: hypothetical protein FWH42_01365 [Dehalococcoidia bacterium]|nr:hypothetical protein [Dehalococcoidia bacterium]